MKNVVIMYSAKDFEWEKFKPFVPNLAPNPKQTTPNAINIQVKPEKIEIPKHLSPFEQGLYYIKSKTKNYLNSHTTIQNAKKWNESVTPIFRRK